MKSSYIGDAKESSHLHQLKIGIEKDVHSFNENPLQPLYRLAAIPFLVFLLEIMPSN